LSAAQPDSTDNGRAGVVSSMKIAGRRSFGVGGLVAAGLLALPIPLPSPSVPQLPLPTPSLPSVVVTASPPALSTPTGVPVATARPAQQPTGGAAPAVSTAPKPVVTPLPITIPFTTISVSSPLDVALLGALITLPLLLGIWLLILGRTLAEARRARDAEVRLVLAADLGLRPRDIARMDTAALFALREKTAFDELTGAYRRVAGISFAEREIARARRRKTPLAVAFVDIDEFQEANEREGREAGDAMLRGLTQLLRDSLRDEDIVFRFGGDEFVCVVPETDARQARRTLDEVQRAAASQGVRISFGVAELARSDDVVSLFARADTDLYEFKAHRGEIVKLPTAGKPGEEHTVPALT
ncbi:MAG TPA: diguanylate cyclase, partial [Gemmataceae bacterium]|nr:diguanylate cyclase [Gemmataceae bacterium]